jgi:hypothetical protein
MNLDFVTDPELAPRPRAEIRVESLALEPYPDGRRVRVDVEITPFAPVDRPNLEITAHNAAGELAGSMSVIETVNRRLSLTMHLRESEPRGQYAFQVDLYYSPDETQHSARESVVIPDQRQAPQSEA